MTICASAISAATVKFGGERRLAMALAAKFGDPRVRHRVRQTEGGGGLAVAPAVDDDALDKVAALGGGQPSGHGPELVHGGQTLKTGE
jgi:hypothetical protein